MLRVRNEGCPWLELHLQTQQQQKTGEKFQKKQCQGCFPSSNLPYAWKCLHAADLDAVTIIVHSVAVCGMLLQLLFTLWPFAGCCYNCSLCGHLQDAVTIIVHSMAVCRMLLQLFTLWPFAGCFYHHCSLCGHLQDTVMIVYSVAVCRILL